MKTFNEFLEEKCEEIESDIMNKDNYEAVADRWFASLDVEELIEFGEEYGKYVECEVVYKWQDKLCVEANKLHDELKKK